MWKNIHEQLINLDRVTFIKKHFYVNQLNDKFYTLEFFTNSRNSNSITLNDQKERDTVFDEIQQLLIKDTKNER